MSAEDRAREAIRTAISRHGITQATLAARVGCSQKHLSCVLVGHSRLSFDFAERLLAATDHRLNVVITQPYQSAGTSGADR